MDRIKSAINKIWSYELSHMFVYSVIINIVMECLNKRGVTGLLSIFTSPVIFLMNTMIIMTTMSVAYFFRKRIFVYSVVSVIWMIIAIVNFMVLCSRKTPFTAMDIYLISDAIKVIPLYINVFEMILIAAGVILVIVGLVALWRKAKEYKPSVTGRKFYIAAIFKCGIVFLLTYSYTAALIINGRVDTHFGNLAHAYQNYGVAYCFTSSIKDRGISKSKEYSQEYMDSLKQDLDETDLDTSDEVSVKTPNIIFVQLESFFDPKLVKGVEFSSNPTPNFDRIRSEYSSGYLSVPCFGAGTANTEFEVQTGVNLDDFGPGEYPYRTVMQSKTCESAAYDLKKIGYATHAIHNNDADYLKQLKILEYDILYGDKQIYNGDIPYVATDLKMGIEDITIDEVYNYKDYVCVAGKNFNDFSKVLINDKEVESELISSTMIKIPKKNVVSKDEVAVIQSGEDKIELGRTTYKVP